MIAGVTPAIEPTSELAIERSSSASAPVLLHAALPDAGRRPEQSRYGSSGPGRHRGGPLPTPCPTAISLPCLVLQRGVVHGRATVLDHDGAPWERRWHCRSGPRPFDLKKDISQTKTSKKKKRIPRLEKHPLPVLRLLLTPEPLEVRERLRQNLHPHCVVHVVHVGGRQGRLWPGRHPDDSPARGMGQTGLEARSASSCAEGTPPGGGGDRRPRRCRLAGAPARQHWCGSHWNLSLTFVITPTFSTDS